MKNPWKDISDAAFIPMFDEHASVKTSDGKQTTFEVAVFVDGMGDPVSDDMLDTEREDVTFVFAKKDWPFVKTLKRGATIRRGDVGTEYAVSESKLDNCLGWCVKARQK